MYTICNPFNAQNMEKFKRSNLTITNMQTNPPPPTIMYFISTHVLHTTVLVVTIALLRVDYIATYIVHIPAIHSEFM